MGSKNSRGLSEVFCDMHIRVKLVQLIPMLPTIVLSDSLPDPGHFPSNLSWHFLWTAVWQPTKDKLLLLITSLLLEKQFAYTGTDILVCRNPKGSPCRKRRMLVDGKILLRICVLSSHEFCKIKETYIYVSVNCSENCIVLKWRRFAEKRKMFIPINVGEYIKLKKIK